MYAVAHHTDVFLYFDDKEGAWVFAHDLQAQTADILGCCYDHAEHPGTDLLGHVTRSSVSTALTTSPWLIKHAEIGMSIDDLLSVRIISGNSIDGFTRSLSHGIQRHHPRPRNWRALFNKALPLV